MATGSRREFLKGFGLAGCTFGISHFIRTNPTDKRREAITPLTTVAFTKGTWRVSVHGSSDKGCHERERGSSSQSMPKTDVMNQGSCCSSECETTSDGASSAGNTSSGGGAGGEDAKSGDGESSDDGGDGEPPISAAEPPWAWWQTSLLCASIFAIIIFIAARLTGLRIRNSAGFSAASWFITFYVMLRFDPKNWYRKMAALALVGLLAAGVVGGLKFSLKYLGIEIEVNLPHEPDMFKNVLLFLVVIYFGECYRRSQLR